MSTQRPFWNLLRPALVTLAASLVTCLCALPAAPTPLASLSWNACTNPIDLAPSAGQTNSIVVTAQGLSGTITGFEFTLMLRAGGSGLADAWRFDGSGCNGGSWQAVVQRAGTGCPILTGPGGNLSTAVWDYVKAQPGFFPEGRIKVAVGYKPSATPGPGLLTVARIVLDQSTSKFGATSGDSCGCLERAVCIELAQASTIGTDGFETPIASNQSNLTWNDRNDTSTLCGAVSDPFVRTAFPDTSCSFDVPVAAHSASWGQVKGMYRAPAR